MRTYSRYESVMSNFCDGYDPGVYCYVPTVRCDNFFLHEVNLSTNKRGSPYESIYSHEYSRRALPS